MGKVIFSLCPHLGGGGGQVSPAGGGGSGQLGGGVSPASGGGGQSSRWGDGGGVSILHPLAGGMPLAFMQEDFLVIVVCPRRGGGMS